VEEFWSATVKLLDAALPNRWVGACLQDIQLIRPMILLTSGGIRRTPEYWKRHFELCPAGPLIQAHPEMEMLRISDQLDGLDWRQTEFYRTYMKDLDCEYSAILVCRERGQFIGVASVQRNRKQGDFTNAEMGLLARLHPHFQTAMRRVLHADNELTATRALRQLWDRLPVPVILLDWDLETLYHNPAGCYLCAVWNRGQTMARAMSSRAIFETPWQIQESCLELKKAWGTSVLEREQMNGHPLRSVDHPDMPELRGHIFVEELEFDGHGRAVFLVELEHRPVREEEKQREEVLRLLARLAPEERELVESVRDGARNAEIARRLGLNVGKLKSKLSGVFRKLSVPSRNKLIALLR
jgi:DNA-binding CsgD family transcriptional regulator